MKKEMMLQEELRYRDIANISNFSTKKTRLAKYYKKQSDHIYVFTCEQTDVWLFISFPKNFGISRNMKVFRHHFDFEFSFKIDEKIEYIIC